MGINLELSICIAKQQGYVCVKDNNAFAGILCKKNDWVWIHSIQHLRAKLSKDFETDCSNQTLIDIGYSVGDYYKYLMPHTHPNNPELLKWQYTQEMKSIFSISEFQQEVFDPYLCDSVYIDRFTHTAYEE